MDKRVLPPGSAEPGPFNSFRTPWVVGITEAIANPFYSSVVMVMASQLSKTDGCLINAIGWQLDDDPQPILYIGPTRKNVESVSNDRIILMIRSVPSLFKGLAKGKKDKITEKFINGVRFGLGWAGSSTELASHPAAKVFIDERDRMGADVEGEGDVNTLADARTATYDGCVITASTPLVGSVEPYKHPVTGMEHWGTANKDDIGSPTWQLWQEGSRHEWCWPCPSCSEYFVPRFKYLWWPEKSTVKSVNKTARVVCPECGDQHEDRAKEWMNARGIFIAPGQKPTLFDDHAEIINDNDDVHVVDFGHYLPLSSESQDVSFWVSGLCSPWRTFGRRASTFLKAVRSGEHGRIQAAINTGFGELYRVSGDAPSWQLVHDCELGYKQGEVPDLVQIITCGCDVQKNRLVYVIRGWGEDYTSYLIDRGEVWGDTEQPHVWAEFQKIVRNRYGDMNISRVMIDSGYRADSVYTFCRNNNMLCYPSKGYAKLDKPFKASNIDVNIRGKVVKNGLKLWHFDSDLVKTFVHERIEWPKDQPGAWYVFSNIDDDYCRQVVAEARSAKPSGQIVWVRVRKDNHYLDCEALAYLAVKTLAAPLRSKQEVAVKRKRKGSRGLRMEDL